MIKDYNAARFKNDVTLKIQDDHLINDGIIPDIRYVVNRNNTCRPLIRWQKIKLSKNIEYPPILIKELILRKFSIFEKITNFLYFLQVYDGYLCNPLKSGNFLFW